MKTKSLLLLVFAIGLLFPIDNFSKPKASKESQSINWNQRAHKDLQAINQYWGRSLRPDEYAHMQWVAKAARLLRGGQALSQKDDLNALAGMNQEEVIDYFINSARFYDSVLDFNLYFLGFRQPWIHQEGRYNPSIFSFQNALQSAIETARGGDYFSFLNAKSSRVLRPLTEIQPQYIDFVEDLPNKESLKKLPSLQRSHAVIDFFISSLNVLDQELKAKTIDMDKACVKFGRAVNFHYFLGLQSSHTKDLPEWNDVAQKYASECFSNPIATEDSEIPKLLITLFQQLKPVVDKYDPTVYKMSSLNEFEYLANSDENISYSDDIGIFNSNLLISLSNSSTNFNRRRGAFVLSRFFCDDLTPINVEMPSEHTGGAHGSEASCYACHYKLDPMSGFFKEHGLYFTDFSEQPSIQFDDGLVVDKEDYQKTWLAPASLGKKWNIGYVRSEKNPKLNDYGETLEDLFKIIRHSYEYKRCIVRRLFRYASDEDQMMDAGYIEYLGREFAKNSEINSSAAIKDLFKTVALSQTFSQSDRDPQACYDMASGSLNGLPCEVRYISEQYCVKCHDSTLSFSGLDMTTWQEVSTGLSGFYHEDDNSQPLNRTESLQRISERLTTNDPKKRMPKSMHMDPLHREQLFLWIQKELQK